LIEKQFNFGGVLISKKTNPVSVWLRHFTLSPPNEVRDSEGEAVALPKVKLAEAPDLINQLFSMTSRAEFSTGTTTTEPFCMLRSMLNCA
jgi:hypothetical protein